MTVPYATPQDVYDRALTARAFVVVPRPLNGAAGDFLDFATGTFWMLGHGLSAADAVWFVPAGVSELPGGASKSVTYTPEPLDSRRFRLLVNGAPATFTDAGAALPGATSGWGLLVDFERRLRASILAESADVDQCLTAHSAPLVVDPITGRYPEKVIDVVCIGAALRSVTGLIFENTQAKAALDRLDAKAKEAAAVKEIWRSGVSIAPVPKDQTDGLADNGARGTNRLTPGLYPYWYRCPIIRGSL